MARYHLTEDGPKVCSARKKCPLQAADPNAQHFDNKAAAMEALAEREAKRHEGHDDTMTKRAGSLSEGSTSASGTTSGEQDTPNAETPVEHIPAAAETALLNRDRAERKALEKISKALKKSGVDMDRVEDDYYTSDTGFFMSEAIAGGIFLHEEETDYDYSSHGDSGGDDDADYPPARYTGEVSIDPERLSHRFFATVSDTDPMSPEGKAGRVAIQKVLDKHGVLDEMNYAPRVIRRANEDDQIVGMEFYGNIEAVLDELRDLTK